MSEIITAAMYNQFRDNMNVTGATISGGVGPNSVSPNAVILAVHATNLIAWLNGWTYANLGTSGVCARCITGCDSGCNLCNVPCNACIGCNAQVCALFICTGCQSPCNNCQGTCNSCQGGCNNAESAPQGTSIPGTHAWPQPAEAMLPGTLIHRTWTAASWNQLQATITAAFNTPAAHPTAGAAINQAGTTGPGRRTLGQVCGNTTPSWTQATARTDCNTTM